MVAAKNREGPHPHRVVKSVSISEGRIEREQLDLCSQAARVTTDKEEEGLFFSEEKACTIWVVASEQH